jgi:hypothetical protein
MTQAKTDNNRVRTLLGVLNTDGSVPTPVKVNPANHALKAVDANTGAPTASQDARRDENQVTTMIVSSTSGVLVELPVDSSGNLLIQST